MFDYKNYDIIIKRRYFREVFVMATSTFNKNIVLGHEAAERLASELRDSTPAEYTKADYEILTKKEMIKWVQELKQKSQN